MSLINLWPVSRLWLELLAIACGFLAGSAINILMYHLPRLLQQNWRQQCYLLLQGGRPVVDGFFSWKQLHLHCLHCNTMLPAWMSLPLLRSLLHSGVCVHCGRHVGRKYMVVEWGTSLLFLVILQQFGVHGSTLVIFLLVSGLILLALIDSTHYLLPDCITLALIWLGLLSNAFGLFVPAEQAILGAVAGYAGFWLIGMVYKLLRGVEGMGRGDYKLLAVFGAWWGIYPLPVIIFLASISGLIVVLIMLFYRRVSVSAPLAFGPHLVGAGLAILFFGKPIMLSL